VEDPRIREVFRKLENLPTLPQIATQMVNAAVSNTSDIDNLVKIIESDPPLSSRILKLINSPKMGLANEVRTIREAAAILGLEGLKSHILGIHAFDMLTKDMKKHRWMRRGLWRHSLAVSCTSELIAHHTGAYEPADASVAGLLHDIGIIALDYCFGETKYEKVMNLMQKEDISFLEAETTVLGVDHTLAGKWVAEKWNLPEYVLAAIWLHHQGSTTPLVNGKMGKLIRIVHLANTICSQQRFGFADSAVELMSIDEQCEKLGLSKQAYKEILPQIGEYVEDRANVLGLDLYERKLYLKALQSANLHQSMFIEKLNLQNRKLSRTLSEFCIIHSFNETAGDSSVLEVLRKSAKTARDFLSAEKTVCFVVDRRKRYLVGEVSVKGAEETETIFISSEKENQAGAKSLNGDRVILQELAARLACERNSSYQFPALPTGGKVAFIPLKVSRSVAGGMFVDNRKSKVELAWRREEVLALADAIAAALARAFLVEQLRETSEKLVESSRETESANVKLLESKKLAAIGRMAAGAAHEMNNPLAIISGRAQLLLEKKKAREELKVHLTVVKEQCDRLSKIISDLLGFARPVKPDIKEENLEGAIDAALADLSEKITGKQIRIVKHIQKNLPKGAFDRFQIIQVFVNVIKNAVEASDEKGTIEISAAASAGRPFLIVKIADAGEGIDAEHLDKIFDPFFSTKQAGRGTGLGLSIAHSIIEAHRGKIRARSALGKGTTFTIHIPKAPNIPDNDGAKA